MPESPSRVLYIAGVGRSGTTLLEQVLAQHPDVVVLGEVVHMWERGLVADELCECGQPFSRCSFWQAIGDEAFGGWRRVDIDRVRTLRERIDRVRRIPGVLAAHAQGRVSSELSDYASLYARIYAAARRITGRSLVVDTSKQVSLPFSVAQHPGVDLRVLHCVRDPRAVAYSWTKSVRRPEALDSESLMTQYTPGLLARRWVSHNAAVPLVARLSVPWDRWRYEDFVGDPTASLSAVCALADISSSGIKHEPEGSHFFKLGSSHTVAGNPMRFQQGTVEVRLDDRWRAGLPESSRRLVTGVAWPMMIRYGYKVGMP